MNNFNAKNMLYDYITDNRYHKTTRFTNLGKIYMLTNEVLDDYKIDCLEEKKVLTVTSSADHILFSVLKGATNITSFDINEFTKIYCNLKISMIKKFEYDDFLKKLTLLSDVSNDKEKSAVDVSTKILANLFEELNKDEIEFWNLYFEYFRNYKSILLKLIDKNIDKSPFNTKEKYYEIKNKLNNVNINYIDSDISDIKEKTNDKFDVIFLSNILDYVHGYNNIKNVIDSVQEVCCDNFEIYFYNFFLSHLKDDVNAVERYVDENKNIKLNKINSRVWKIERK